MPTPRLRAKQWQAQDRKLGFPSNRSGAGFVIRTDQQQTNMPNTVRDNRPILRDGSQYPKRQYRPQQVNWPYDKTYCGQALKPLQAACKGKENLPDAPQGRKVKLTESVALAILEARKTANTLNIGASALSSGDSQPTACATRQQAEVKPSGLRSATKRDDCQ